MVKPKLQITRKHIYIIFPCFSLKLPREYLVEEKHVIYNPISKTLMPLAMFEIVKNYP